MKLELVYAILALVPSISSHAVIIDAWGEANKAVHGCAIGVIPSTNRKNTAALGQQDTSVYANPTIPDPSCRKGTVVNGWNPNCAACSCVAYCKVAARRMVRRDPTLNLFGGLTAKIQAAKDAAAQKAAAAKLTLAHFTTCRKTQCTGGYLPNCQKCPTTKTSYDKNSQACRPLLTTGCGRTQYVDSSALYTIDGKDYWKKPTGYLNIDAWTSQMAQRRVIPQVYAGGVLFMTLHQINPDGGGPYTCLIDYGGKAEKWETITLKMIANVAGVKGLNPFQLKQWPLTAQLPDNMRCTGTYGGANKICMVRCNNEAPNGPFGGCVPIQQVGGDPPAPPPVVPVKPAFPTVAPYKPTQEKIEDEYEDDDVLVEAVEQKEKVPETEAEAKNKEEELNPEQIALLEKAGYYNKPH
ncbi:hypothetical protein ABW20_dc0102079 [Dactylellina cionopaga]|nr:hypothetical protein ABW20_dc0102079 [Dactylellina cionopaga]